jgi:Zn-dependent metalloprotease
MSLDVIAHELAHGVTEHAAGLVYSMQSGALNESMSDVFGSLVKQWALNQTAEEADWLIGAEIFTPGGGADALRSVKAPGSAYDNRQFGKDPQPDHINKLVRLPDTEEGDFGGVHINSGIPNKAFHVVATEIGGPAWDAPGHIWYEALKASNERTQFQQFADSTYLKAGQLYGTGSAQQQAVVEGWREVGLRISGVPIAAGGGAGKGRKPVPAGGGAGREADSLAALKAQIEALAVQVKALGKDVAGMKERA